MEKIEGINWMLNEYLAVRFTHRHKVIFEEQMEEMRIIFSAVRNTIATIEPISEFENKGLHAQAA